MTSNACFEEVLENCDDQPVDIDQLARLLQGSRTASGAEICVRLTRSSPDVSTRRHHRRDDDGDDVDLPRNSDISLTGVFVESCVLASVDSADRPAFHLPLRTDMDVRLVRYLDRRNGPLGHSHRQLSTTDRCVEPLDNDDLAAFMINCRRDLSTDCKRSVPFTS